MAVTVWAMRQDRPLTEEETQRLTALLPPARRERLERQRVRAKREEALCAYGLLTLALRRQYGLRELPPICQTEKGKPLFCDPRTVFFSLSHTEGAVLAAVADRNVGADVEKIRPVGRKLQEQLGADTAEDFFRCWVRREARSKRTGEGIASMLREEPPPGPGEFCFALELFEGYAACVAAEEPQPPRVQTVSQEELLREL